MQQEFQGGVRAKRALRTYWCVVNVGFTQSRPFKRNSSASALRQNRAFVAGLGASDHVWTISEPGVADLNVISSNMVPQPVREIRVVVQLLDRMLYDALA